MNDEERLKLDQMLKDNNVENMTDKIRELRHSKKILEDVQSMIEIKRKYARLAKTNPKQFETMIVKRCNFYLQNTLIFIIVYIKISWT